MMSAEHTNEAKQLKELAELSVEQCAKLMRVSRQTYHKWLQGKPMRLKHQKRLLELLDIYRKKGWLHKVQPLTWGAARLSEAEQQEALDRLSPRPYLEHPLIDEDNGYIGYLAFLEDEP